MYASEQLGSTTDWLLSPRIYIQRGRKQNRVYDVTEEALRSALEAETAGRVKPLSITAAFSDALDENAWRAADILITRKLDGAAIAKASRLRVIQTTSAGIEESLPLNWLPPGVILCNASGVHASKAREFGAMAVLMLHQHVPAQMTSQRLHDWNRRLRPTSRGKRVLIYGAGALGTAVADGLAGFGFELHGVGRTDTGARPGFAHSYGTEALERLLPETDVLVIAAPLTPETKGRFGRHELSLMPPGASLMNIARAGVLDHDALVEFLLSGHLSGAILDVLEHEPLPADSPLWDVPNLMIFPHVAGDSPPDYPSGCARLLARNLAALLDGRPICSQVDPALGY